MIRLLLGLVFIVAFVHFAFPEVAWGRDSESPDNRLRQAVAQRTSGDVEGALSSLVDLSLDFPQQFSVHFELAVTRFWLGQSAEGLDSLEICRQQLAEDDERRAAVMELRGRLLLADSQWREALNELREGTEKYPTRPSMRAALGTTERAALHPKRAREQYEAALRLDDGNEEARQGLLDLPSASAWEVTTSARAASSGDETTAAGRTWTPAGEVFVRHRFNPDDSVFARWTQQMPRWGDPGGPTAQGRLLSRGEAGLGFRPEEHTAAELSYLQTHSAFPVHHALLAAASRQFDKTVLLASVRPGLDVQGRIDVLGQLGVQQQLGAGAWGMLQAFQYAGQASASYLRQSSTTLVGTLAHEGKWASLRLGGGIGWFDAGRGYPAFAQAKFRITKRFRLGASYEGFFGFFTQHQLGVDAEVRF